MTMTYHVYNSYLSKVTHGTEVLCIQVISSVWDNNHGPCLC